MRGPLPDLPTVADLPPDCVVAPGVPLDSDWEALRGGLDSACRLMGRRIVGAALAFRWCDPGRTVSVCWRTELLP